MADQKISQLSALGGEPASGDEFVLNDSGTTKKVTFSNLTGNFIKQLKDDGSPQLGGDLDLNGNNLDFPTTKNISDVLDENDLSSNSSTKLATQSSIKSYVDNNAGGGSAITLDLGDDGSNESTDMDELATTNDSNNIVTNPTGDKALMDFSKNYPTADEVAINSLTSHGSNVASSDEIAIADVSDSNNVKKTTAQDIADLSSGGAKVVLDLGDDGSNESTDMSELATTSDSNNIVTEPSNDKALFDMSKNWPTSDAVASLSGNNVESTDNVAVSSPAAGEVLIYHGTNSQFENSTLTGGTEISISNSDASITINSDFTPSSTDTLTNKTFDVDGTGNSLSNVSTSEIKSSAKTGADSQVVTGLAGADGDLGQWNSDGDLDSVSIGDGIEEVSQTLKTEETFVYDTGMTQWADGLSNEEINRIVLQTGETLVIDRIEFRQKGGGSSSSASVRAQDTSASSTIGSQDLGGTTKDPGSSGTANTVQVQVSNSTGSSINASVRVIGRIQGA